MQRDLILWLQARGAVPAAVMKFLSGVGRGVVYYTLGALVWWSGRKRLGFRLLGLLTLSGIANSLLKMALHEPRPYWVWEGVRGLAHHTSYGMPSGHAQSAAVFLGGLALSERGRWWVWAAALPAIFAIGLSRVWLGVHSPAQVAVGWLVGLGIAWSWIRLEDPVASRLGHWPRWKQIAAASVVPLASLVLGLAIKAALLASWQVPRAWVHRAGARFPDDPFPLYHLAQASGALLGLSLGALVSRRLAPEPMGPRTLVRFLVGLVVLGLWALLGKLLNLRQAHAAVPFTYSLMSGLMVSAGLPWLFDRLGLWEHSLQNASGPP